MNKNELIEAVAAQIEGGKKQATEAVEAVLDLRAARVLGLGTHTAAAVKTLF